MKKYIAPEIVLLLFDEEEILTTSVATYADKLIQQYTFGKDGHGDGVGVGSSVSVKLQDVQIK